MILALFTIFAVIGISEVIRGLTIKSDTVTGARFFYTWGIRVILFVFAGAILAGGLYISSWSLSAIRWSGVRPTIWAAIFAVMLILPTIALVWLNLRR